MRAKLFFVAAALGFTAASASADIIQNFVIVTASDYSTVGGTLDLGNTFGGTFSVDISTLPGDGDEATLPAVDAWTTAIPAYGVPFVDYDYGLILNYVDDCLGDEGCGPGMRQANLVMYELVLSNASSEYLDLYVAEVTGTFVGGQIIAASEGGDYDYSGDAVAVDPDVLSPEPGTFAMLLGGAALLGLGLARRARQTPRS